MLLLIVRLQLWKENKRKRKYKIFSTKTRGEKWTWYPLCLMHGFFDVEVGDDLNSCWQFNHKVSKILDLRNLEPWEWSIGLLWIISWALNFPVSFLTIAWGEEKLQYYPSEWSLLIILSFFFKFKLRVLPQSPRSLQLASRGCPRGLPLRCNSLTGIYSLIKLVVTSF